MQKNFLYRSSNRRKKTIDKEETEEKEKRNSIWNNQQKSGRIKRGIKNSSNWQEK